MLIQNEGEILSGYRIMWMLVMFDLPTFTAEERKAANDFRLNLLDLGYERAQLSVYMRVCTSWEHFNRLTKKIEMALPDGGKVDILQFSDKQYEKIISFHSAMRDPPKKIQNNLYFFDTFLAFLFRFEVKNYIKIRILTHMEF